MTYTWIWLFGVSLEIVPSKLDNDLGIDDTGVIYQTDTGTRDDENNTNLKCGIHLSQKKMSKHGLYNDLTMREVCIQTKDNW